MSHQIIQPEGWAPAKGYANGVLSADGHLFVGGQIGWTAEQKFECHDFIGQMKQALQNILNHGRVTFFSGSNEVVVLDIQARP